MNIYEKSYLLLVKFEPAFNCSNKSTRFQFLICVRTGRNENKNKSKVHEETHVQESLPGQSEYFKTLQRSSTSLGQYHLSAFVGGHWGEKFISHTFESSNLNPKSFLQINFSYFLSYLLSCFFLCWFYSAQW